MYIASSANGPQDTRDDVKLKVNDRLIKTILDTGSQVTVISQEVYGAIDRKFENRANPVSR